MFAVGDLVRVLEPFTSAHPDVYEITEIVTHPDGQVAYILGERGGFADQYIEHAS